MAPSSKSRVRATLAIAALASLMLAGCGSSTAPAPTEASPPPSTSTSSPAPTEDSSATSQPAADPTVELPAGWETLTVDDWAIFNVPAGWTQVTRPASPNGLAHFSPDTTDNYLVDASGEVRVRVLRVAPTEELQGGECAPRFEWFEVLNTTPLPVAHSGEELAESTTIEALTIFDNEFPTEWFGVTSSVHQPAGLTDSQCSPMLDVYPATGGGYYRIHLVSSGDEGLFKTEAEAKAYTETEEYKAIQKVIQSFRFIQ